MWQNISTAMNLEVFLYMCGWFFICFFPPSSAQVTVAGLSTTHQHTYMRVSVAASSAVHVQDATVQRFLVVQRKGHCVQTTSPILPTRFLQRSTQHLERRTCFEEFVLYPRHSALTAIVWSRIRPPLMFWYSRSFSACSLSFSERSRKKVEKCGRAISSLSKNMPLGAGNDQQLWWANLQTCWNELSMSAYTSPTSAR